MHLKEKSLKCLSQDLAHSRCLITPCYMNKSMVRFCFKFCQWKNFQRRYVYASLPFFDNKIEIIITHCHSAHLAEMLCWENGCERIKDKVKELNTKIHNSYQIVFDINNRWCALSIYYVPGMELSNLFLIISQWGRHSCLNFTCEWAEFYRAQVTRLRSDNGQLVQPEPKPRLLEFRVRSQEAAAYQSIRKEGMLHLCDKRDKW